MEYQDVKPISRQEALYAFSSGSSEAIADALIRVVFHDPDWRWVQNLCLEYTKHRDKPIVFLAITCFGHLARIHRRLDLDRVLPILEKLGKDEETAGRVEDALDDIRIFLSST